MPCLNRYRCAAIRTMYAQDPRLIDTIRDVEWRRAMQQAPEWCLKLSLRDLRRRVRMDQVLLDTQAVGATSRLERHRTSSDGKKI